MNGVNTRNMMKRMGMAAAVVLIFAGIELGGWSFGGCSRAAGAEAELSEARNQPAQGKRKRRRGKQSEQGPNVGAPGTPGSSTVDDLSEELGLAFKDDAIDELIEMIEGGRGGEAVEKVRLLLTDRTAGERERQRELTLAQGIVLMRTGDRRARGSLFNIASEGMKTETVRRAEVLCMVFDARFKEGTKGQADLQSRDSWFTALRDVRGSIEKRLGQEQTRLKEAVRQGHEGNIRQAAKDTLDLVEQHAAIRLEIENQHAIAARHAELIEGAAADLNRAIEQKKDQAEQMKAEGFVDGGGKNGGKGGKRGRDRDGDGKPDGKRGNKDKGKGGATWVGNEYIKAGSINALYAQARRYQDLVTMLSDQHREVALHSGGKVKPAKIVPATVPMDVN
ncbi:MAG: hypothetical protein IBJ18_13525 [Phycisphaerales bacterium]|nr:hypothetical protein [Phycisphaerales bacterium]